MEKIPLTREEFSEVIGRLQAANELVDRVDELFRSSRENVDCDFCNGASLQISHERTVVELLAKLMRDREGKIGCFIYELDYGRDYRPGGEGDFGEEGNLASAGSLYDHLAANYRRNAGNCEKWRGEDGETDQLSGD